MEDPEAYLRAMAARPAWARDGSPLPVTRFSVEAVANALVILGLLPAVRAEEILAAQRPLQEACFRITATDDTGVKHDGIPDSSSHSPALDGTGSFWLWPPVPPRAKQLRVIVGTLWEAAWALIDIPGR